MSKMGTLFLEEQEKAREFAEQEHRGGQHKEYVENCGSCNSPGYKPKKVASNYPEGINRFNPPWND